VRYNVDDLEADSNLEGNLVFVLSLWVSALLSAPSRRGIVLRWLSSLGARGSQQEEAASVASLLCTRSAAEAFRYASRNFRALPYTSLKREHLLDSKPDPRMHSLTVSAVLGEVDAFVSHSWQDSGGAKFHCLQAWEEAQKAAGLEDIQIWLDKACIDQLNIDKCLEGLPIFLAGCRIFLVLAGQTYTTRLWCAMEMFIYIRMSDKAERIDVKTLKSKRISEDFRLEEDLMHFDALKAQCYLDRDRQKLLAVVETAFGTTEPFNKLVREIFDKKIRGNTKKKRRFTTWEQFNKAVNVTSAAMHSIHEHVQVENPRPSFHGNGNAHGHTFITTPPVPKRSTTRTSSSRTSSRSTLFEDAINRANSKAKLFVESAPEASVSSESFSPHKPRQTSFNLEDDVSQRNSSDESFSKQHVTYNPENDVSSSLTV